MVNTCKLESSYVKSSLRYGMQIMSTFLSYTETLGEDQTHDVHDICVPTPVRFT